MRVFELAKKMGTTSKELMTVLKKMDIYVSNHMGALTEDDVQAVLKKGGLKPAKKSSKKGKVLKAEPSPPPPKKKRFVLIKKKVAPVVSPPPEEVLAEAVAGDIPPEKVVETVSTPIPEEVVVATPELAPPVAEETSAAETPVATEPESVTPSVVPEEKPVTAKTPEEPPAKPTPAKKETAVAPEKKKEKKKAKIETPVKAKEKPKRAKRGAWDPRAATAGKPGGPAGDSRKWQDFKPIHRKDDRRGRRSRGGPVVDAAAPRRKVIKIHEGLTVKEFSELIGDKVSSIIKKLMEFGKMATMNQTIGLEEAALIAESLGVQTELVAAKTEEELLMHTTPDLPESLKTRAPVITIMGHVDHGKTSLLDAIRATKVTEGEAGGITQHIGAYMVEASGKMMTFLDTPGHEAFTSMRARGAQATDIVIIVVAADDGVMPQTVEAINHAKQAKVPIIVAVNKVDLPDANPDRVKQAVAEYELIPEEWGGETIFAEVSAKTKVGLDHLLEMVLLQSEVLELKANPDKAMLGVIIEAKIEKGRGPVATVLVQEGTLKVGDAFVTGTYFGKVRSLINDEGKRVKTAGPSMPVEVIGIAGVPLAGDTFISVSDERAAKEVVSKRAERERNEKLTSVRRVTLDDLYQGIQDGTAKELKVIIKADVQGSAEALKQSLEKLTTDSVRLQVIHAGVGGITESDILLAAAAEAFVVGFNVRPEAKGKALAEKEHVDIRLYSIIYEVIAEVRAAMEGLLDPILKERILGRVEVRQTFSVPKLGTIAGGYVKEGIASKTAAGVRVFRNDAVVYDGKLASLRRFKDDVKEVQTGYECGLGVEGFKDIQVEDILELYIFDKIPAKLESA